MAINIQAKTDYTYLFSSLGSSSSSGTSNLSFLSDYAAIKNGSYGKLMKAYFNGSSDAVSSLVKSSASTVTETEAKSLAKVQTATDALKESADELLTTGSKSLFTKKEITTKDENGTETTSEGYDTDAIYKAVSSFVTNYNSVIDAVNSADNDKVTTKAVSMVNATIANVNLLNNIGITINDDSTLSIDKDTFSKADMNTVKTLFNGTGSYGYRVSAQASMINFAADSEVNKSSFYTSQGTVTNLYSTGNLFSSLL